MRLFWDYVSLPLAAHYKKLALLHYFKGGAVWRLPPAVVTIYDVIPLLFPQLQSRGQYLYWRQQLPRAARVAEHIVTISQQSKRDIMRVLKVKSSRISVIPPAPDEIFRPRSAAEITRLSARYLLPRPYLLFVGALEPRKNLPLLIRAFNLIAARIPHHLVIAGKAGRKLKSIQKAVRESPARQRIHFLSYLPRENLPALYSGADLFLFPSLYEGWGLPPMEALACGTPSIVARTSSLPEALGPGALYLPPHNESLWAEAIMELLTQPARAQNLVRAGQNHLKQFTWRAAAEELWQLYRNILG
jgi:glycosyltransferase involved in cell wall biosynthesis